MPVALSSAEQASTSLASAADCASRALQALEYAGHDEAQGRRERHDLRACLGTLIAALQLLDRVPPDSDLAAGAREIAQRHVLRIDKLLEQPPWSLQ
jgi:hypothetical protein